jgi:hypothetical protein
MNKIPHRSCLQRHYKLRAKVYQAVHFAYYLLSHQVHLVGREAEDQQGTVRYSPV